MKIILIGYGKMGQFIYQALKNCEMTSQLVVIDSKIKKAYEEDGIRFLKNEEDINVADFDCVFVSTPATTHCEIAEYLIKAGCKNIYMEKPAVMNKEEFNKILKIKKDCKFVTGYILRQSEPMFALKCIIDKMQIDGYQLDHCDVTYQKNLPFSLEERAQGDIGVFEEIVHIWDLLFNYLGFKLGVCEKVQSTLESDPEKKDRIIYAQLSYSLKFQNTTALLRVTSSFKAIDKKREFCFTYKHNNGDCRHIFLSFDNEDGYDLLYVKKENGDILYEEKYPSLAKLDHQVEEVLNYFRTGSQYNLSLFEDSATVLDFLNDADVSF